MTDELATSADILVGADAFLERGAQVLDAIGIGFVCGHADPFEPGFGGIWSDDPVRYLVSLAYGGFIDGPITPSLPARRVRRVMSEHERGSANRAVYGWLCRQGLEDDLEVAAIDGSVEIQEAAVALINFERDTGLNSPAYNHVRRELEVAAARVLWAHRATAMPACVHPMQVDLRARLLDIFG